MLRTWRAVGLAILGVALAAATARPARADEIQSELAQIRKALEELNRDLKVRVIVVEERLKTVDALERRLASNEQAVADLRGLVKDLNVEVLRLREELKGPAGPRISRYPSPQTSLTGTVRITNQTALKATVFLNNVAYDVPPNRYLDVTDVPAGEMTYEVALDFYGTIRPLTRRVFMPGATPYPITVYFR